MLPGCFGGHVTDRIKVVASEPNTEVTVNGVLVRTLNKGGVYEFFVDPEGSFISSSLPISVMLIPNGLIGNSTGAPCMIGVAPIEQKLKEINFTTANPSSTTYGEIDHHYVLITTPSATKNQTVLSDGTTNLILDFKKLINDTTFSSAVVEIFNNKNYNLTNNFGGFTAYVYGQGDKIGYGYSAGSAAVLYIPPFNLNGSSALNSDKLTQTICVSSAITFDQIFPRILQ